MKQSQIQNFNLFGEVGDLPDVVHCETIETRSQLHDWEFSPHRHARLHQILLISDGGGMTEIDGTPHVLAPGQFINMPTGTVHGFSFLADTRGWVVTLAAEFLDEILRDSEGLRPVLMRPLIGGASLEIRAIMEAIFQVFNDRRFARAHLLRSQSAQLLGQVARQMFETGNARAPATETSLQRRFEDLVDKHFLAHWTVAQYAAALAISTTHLSRVMRQTTGMPASRIIEARMIREARRQLIFTNLGISQIAYALGYIDPAYFSRTFSKVTGLSPKAFRAQSEGR